MKALDPVKLLGITFNQSPTQDRGAKSERAHAQYIKGLGLCMARRGKGTAQSLWSPIPHRLYNYRHGRKREDGTGGRS